MKWPRGPVYWWDGRCHFASVPFTWNLASVGDKITKEGGKWRVGGPAVKLMPEFLAGIPDVQLGGDHTDALLHVNPYATRTTVGCPNECGFCGVRKIEGEFKELDDWYDAPVLIDSNLLAASVTHFDRVMDRLEAHGWCDFNQGLDAALLTEHHADRIGRIRKAIVRLSLDSDDEREQWLEAVAKLKRVKVGRDQLRTYVLVGFHDDPESAWSRCQFVRDNKSLPCPMWYHPLDALTKNDVVQTQQALGWNDYERRRIMQWFYQHKRAKETPSARRLPDVH